MRTADKFELFGILCVSNAVALISIRLPLHVESSHLLVTGALLFLFQSLIRDLFILIQTRKQVPKGEEMRCICVETIIGFVPVLLAGALLAAGASTVIHIPLWLWPVGAAAIMLAGFMLKDFVLVLKPFRIRREPNHMNIIVKWNPG